MRVRKIDLNSHHDVRSFLELPFQVYRDIPQWVPPLAMDARRMLQPRRHPFYRHSEAAFFLAQDGRGVSLGRLAILDNRPYNEFNKSHTAFFALFECMPKPQAAQALFENGLSWASGRGLQEIEGPKGLSIMDGLGLLIEGFAHRPAFGIPYNPPYYASYIEAAGFEPRNDIVSGHLSADTQFPEKIHQVAELVRKRRGLRVMRFKSRRDLRGLVPIFRDLYNAALGGTSGSVPLSEEEAQGIADQMLWFADPRLIKVVMKGDEPVGFLFAYPDISAAVQRTKGQLWPWGWIDLLREFRRTKWVDINGAGIVEKYRGLGGTALLFSEMCKSIVEGGFTDADIVQIGTENLRMQRELRDLGVEFYKTHRIYHRTLPLS